MDASSTCGLRTTETGSYTRWERTSDGHKVGTSPATGDTGTVSGHVHGSPEAPPVYTSDTGADESEGRDGHTHHGEVHPHPSPPGTRTGWHCGRGETSHTDVGTSLERAPDATPAGDGYGRTQTTWSNTGHGGTDGTKGVDGSTRLPVPSFPKTVGVPRSRTGVTGRRRTWTLGAPRDLVETPRPPNTATAGPMCP